jgi:hypothetical protein
MALLKGAANADESAASADCARAFIHRKKSLQGLRQKNACKKTYFTGSVGIRISRDVFQKGRPGDASSKRLFPANRPKADARDSNRGPLHYEF